jgi:hypothetical protein
MSTTSSKLNSNGDIGYDILHVTVLDGNNLKPTYCPYLNPYVRLQYGDNVSISDAHSGIKCDFHWSTAFHNLSKEIRYSDSLSDRTAWMVRYFDVTWKNNQANPTAIASLPKNLPLQSAAVFIQRQVLEKTPRSQIPQLSNQIVSLIQQMEIGHQKAKEILIDFDWGKSTKENYFELIQQLKEKLPHKNISATVRLSQFANPRMYGVPPTDRGLLMMYQTGSLNQPEKPLLWEKSEVQQYLKQSN